MKENKITCSECGADITNLIETIIDLDENLQKRTFNEIRLVEKISELKALLEIANKENLELQNKIKSEAEKEQKIDYILENVKKSLELLEQESKKSLTEFINSNEFSNNLLTWTIGRKDNNTQYVADLRKISHLLIAGSNYSEINDCINNLILSLVSHLPHVDELKFSFMEQNYHPISRILTELPTELLSTPPLSDAREGLTIIHRIMEDRYEKYVSKMVKNIEDYNVKIAEKGGDKDYYIIAIIKDLEDLMKTKNLKKTKEHIIKLLQFGKAVGIHLILATQTPTEQVIPFDIRANIPSRLAFKLKSAEESNIILDCAGAEKLTGKGDMLFLPQNEQKPIHIQSAYVSSNEVKKVIEFLAKQYE